MSTIAFDRLAYVDTLTRSGVPEEQARAQADALDVALSDTVATKADMTLLRHDLKEMESRITANILKWMFAALLGQTAIITALVKLL